MQTQRIKMALPNSNYFVVAEIYESMPNHQEIDVMIEDKDGVLVQDIVRIEPTISQIKENYIGHDQDMLTVLLYEDEFNEDYTKKSHIRIYKENEEDTNY